MRHAPILIRYYNNIFPITEVHSCETYLARNLEIRDAGDEPMPSEIKNKWFAILPRSVERYYSMIIGDIPVQLQRPIPQ